jgi:hypothetical protein
MMTAKVEALQADAERYRVGREAAFAGLLVDFPHTKTWSAALTIATLRKKVETEAGKKEPTPGANP